MAQVYGVFTFTISGSNYSVVGTVEVTPAAFVREAIVAINTTEPSFSEKVVQASITGTILKPKEVKAIDILQLADVTVKFKNGSTGKMFTLANASQVGDGKYNPYNGELPINFVGLTMDEVG